MAQKSDNSSSWLLSLSLSILFHASPILSLFFALKEEAQSTNTFVEIQYVRPASPPAPRRVKMMERQIIEQDIPLDPQEPSKNTNFVSQANQNVKKETRTKNRGNFQNIKNSGYNNLEDKERDSDFKINEGQENNASASSQSNDYLKDIEEGMKTVVNTREFIYYSYYNQIRTAVQKHWTKNVHERVKIIHRDDRDIAETSSRVTRISVQIGGDGDIRDIQILRSSGNEFADGSAIKAFRDAQPFPKPPAELLESDNLIKIHWDFILD